MLLSLLDLFYQTRRRFWTLDVEVYCEAMSELHRLAYLAGQDPNEIAQALQKGDR